MRSGTRDASADVSSPWLRAYLPEQDAACPAVAGLEARDDALGIATEDDLSDRQWSGEGVPSGGRQRDQSETAVPDDLYMAALVPTRRNAVIRVFYQRLLAAEKPRTLALVACMQNCSRCSM